MQHILYGEKQQLKISLNIGNNKQGDYIQLKYL